MAWHWSNQTSKRLHYIPGVGALILLRRFATELAREEARMLCDELMAEEAMALIRHDLIAA